MRAATAAMAGLCAMPSLLPARALELAPMERGASLINFDIPRQPLATALVDFGLQADLQVLYESTLAQGRRSMPVIGAFTRDDALQLLLQGSNLVASFADDRSVVLHPVVPILLESETVASIGGGGRLTLRTLKVEGEIQPDFTAYNGVIAFDLQRALLRNAQTRHGNYQVDARIWIGATGDVRRAELVRTTGDHHRDDAVFRTLQELVVSRMPPADMPEPVLVSIVVKPLRLQSND
ncbi:MAG TPA: secretin and TonB N-terminal domain-containing protein [Rhizomicrobium sp.]